MELTEFCVYKRNDDKEFIATTRKDSDFEFRAFDNEALWANTVKVLKGRLVRLKDTGRIGGVFDNMATATLCVYLLIRMSMLDKEIIGMMNDMKNGQLDIDQIAEIFSCLEAIITFESETLEMVDALGEMISGKHTKH